MSEKKKSTFFKKVYIYLEAIVYGILVILAIFASTYGPAYLRMVPLVFFLGMIGRIVFDRPVVTSLFGFCISLCEIQILGGRSLSYNLIYSLYNFFCIMLGEMAGMYIYNIFSSKNKTLTKKLAKNISLLVLTTFIGIFFNKYLNGDIISYIKSRNLLYSYIEEKYPSRIGKVKISKSRYVYGDLNYYLFTVDNLEDDSDKSYNIGVYLNKKVIDGYYDSSLSNMNVELNDKFKFKFSSMNFESLKVSMHYIDLSRKIVINIEKNVETIDEKVVKSFAEEVNDALYKLSQFDEFNNVYKVNAMLKDGYNAATSEIYSDSFFDVEKYINSFNFEYFEV